MMMFMLLQLHLVMMLFFMIINLLILHLMRVCE